MGWKSMNKKKGPWTITDTKKIYENEWMTVIEDKVIRPDGKNGIYSVVNIKPGVAVLPMDDKENVYLTKEYHYAVERVTIEVVSGGIEQGETKLEAAKRELREEAGLKAEKWIKLGIIDPFTASVVSPIELYLAQKISKVKETPEGTETMEIIKIPLKKAIQWVYEGKITESGSVVVILKANNYIQTMI
jgi:ADP-ribose pyrophosphatase